MPLQIKSAEKHKQYARVCLWGVEKSGKTHTALMLAEALAGENGKVGVISSEYGSSKLLSHKFPHEIIDLSEADENNGVPVKNAFAPQRYEQAVNMLVEAGYKAIVIDSLSHAWDGEGGMLEAVSKKGGNTFSDGWKETSPIYKHLINTILAARCHIIVTLRAKEAYVMDEYIKRDGTKGTSPRNAGQAPVIRKGFGYEMQLTIRMDSMTANIEASAVEDYIHKGEAIEKPTSELAYRLLEALDGVPLPEPTAQQIEMRQLLDEFYNLSPSTYARIPNWEQMALSKALDAPIGQLPAPQTYTDDDVQRMRLYVASKKPQNKAS